MTDQHCISPATSKGGFPVIWVICHELVICHASFKPRKWCTIPPSSCNKTVNNIFMFAVIHLDEQTASGISFCCYGRNSRWLAIRWAAWYFQERTWGERWAGEEMVNKGKNWNERKMGQHMLFSLVVTLTLTSFSGSLTYLSREPGWVRSRVSKNLGDYKQTIGGGGADKCEIVSAERWWKVKPSNRTWPCL